MEDKVLSHNEAIQYLKNIAIENIRNYEKYGYDPSAIADVVEETFKDIEKIICGEWEWVCIESCDMASNGIFVSKMVKEKLHDA